MPISVERFEIHPMKQPPIELFRQALGSDRAPKHFFSSGRQTSVIRDFGSHLDARLGPSQAPPDRLEESRHKQSLVSVGALRCGMQMYSI